MEHFYSFIAASIVLIFLSILVLKALNFIWLKPKRMEKLLRAQGLKGNTYKPFLGDLKESRILLQKAHSNQISISDDFLPRVFPLFVKTIDTYGKSSFIWIGPKPSVLILDPHLIKQILLRYSTFRKHGFNGLTKLVSEGIVSYEGHKWLKHRKIISPAFYVEKLKYISSAFIVCTNEMLRKWEDMMTSSEEVDVWDDLQNLSSDAISRAAFGSSYEEGKRIFDLQREQADNFQIVERTVLYIPGYRFFPTKLNRRMHFIKKEVEDSIYKIVEKRLMALKGGESSSDDLLGLLLESNDNEIKEGKDKKFGITMNEIIQECKLFYFAGAETTSSLLVWTLVLLSRYQEWQIRAREEVLQVFGINSPRFEGLNNLKTVTMILNEILRLYPPIASINRKVDKDTVIGNYSLPAGTILTMPIMMVHHSKEIWGDDAKEFNPERFGNGISDATKGQPSFLPFGGGPRICIGQNFSLMESKLALAMILQRFSFELSSSYAHAPKRIITLQPQHGAPLVFQKL